MNNEKITVNYLNRVIYKNDILDVIGATTNETLRNITTSTDLNTKYVRKFGVDYAIGSITNAVIDNPRSDGGGANKWWYEFYNENDTLLGTVKDENGASAFTAGTPEASEKVYIKIIWKSGTVSITAGDVISLTTNVDPDLDVFFSAESFTSGELLVSLSSTGSTYYMISATDFSYKYGGYRHVEDGTLKYPYFKILDAIDDVILEGGAFSIVTVLDSMYYSEGLITTNYSGLIIQSDLGQTPVLLNVVGQFEYAEQADQFNNGNSRFYNEAGNDVNPGTWKSPKLTLNSSQSALSGRSYIVYGGFNASKDNGIFDERLAVNGSYGVVTEYGYLPTINYTLTSAAAIENNQLTYFYNYNLIGCWKGLRGSINSILKVYNCTFDTSFRASIELIPGSSADIDINYCYLDIVEEANQALIQIVGPVGGLVNVQNCFLLNGTAYGFYREGGNVDVSLINNIFDGSLVGVGTSASGDTVYNCLFSNNPIGLQTAQAGSEVKNNIFITCSTSAIPNIGGTIDYNCYYNNGGGEAGTNRILADPLLIPSAGYDTALDIQSPCRRAGSDNGDVGIRSSILSVDNNNVELNGLILDCMNEINNSITAGGVANYTGLLLNWITVKNAKGSSLNIYHTGDIDSTITLSRIESNYHGGELTANGMTITKNEFVRNDQTGIYINNQPNTISNNVFYFNNIALDLDISVPLYITAADNIFHENTIYDIQSYDAITIGYSCITGQINSEVTLTDTNTLDDPLFISTVFENENFQIKTEESGYKFNSPCKNSGTSGEDIGAYIVDRDISENYWRKYQLGYNPLSAVYGIGDKGLLRFNDGAGSLQLWTTAFKRFYKFTYGSKTASSEVLRSKLEYFSTLILNGENKDITPEQTLFRLKFLSSEKILTSSCTIVENTQDESGETKLLEDASLNLVENQLKGFWADIIFYSGVATVDKTTKKITFSGASFTIDEFKGYTINYNGYPYYMKSNTADEIIVSDPEVTLINDTLSLNISKSFRILINSKNAFILSDENNELSIGSYNYEIEFIETKIQRPGMTAKQLHYNYKQEVNKTGFGMIMEES